MPALPEGWELDYDGSRWIYRFTASGLTQYQFPKPGDEFPEFVAVGGFFDMAPEDCLASDRQVKRQSKDEVGADPTKPSAPQRKKKSLEDIKEVEATEYFDTEKFMYLGPGSFFGSDPFGHQQTRIKLEAKQPDTERQQTPPSIKQCGEEAKATPASKGAKSREANATTAHSTQTKLRMQSPVGFVAELASHETRKQADDMSKIEPGVSDSSTADGLDVHLNGLVELPAHGNPMYTKQPRPQEAKVTSAQSVDSYPLVWASFAFPPLPPKQPIDPPETARFSKSTLRLPKSSPQEMARPLSCHEAQMFSGNDLGDIPNRGETRFASMPEMPTLPTLRGVKHQEPKRHSIQGPGPVAALPSRHPILPMPPSDLESRYSSGVMDFQNHRTAHPAPRVPPKIPLIPAGINPDSVINTARIPGSEARHESISSDTSQAFTSSLRSSGWTQCPSVLRPGYYRSSATSPPQQSQRPLVLAAPDGQQPHRQRLPHALTIQHSHHAHEPLTPQAKLKPQWHGGQVFEMPAVRMPDERDFAVRPTATTGAVSEPAIVSSPTTVSSPKSPSNGPGLMIFHEIGPIGSKRESEIHPITSRTGQSWTKDIHELGGDRPPASELPSDGGASTKLDQPLPFVAPLRLSPSASRRQGELSPSTASATQELAAMPLVQREHAWATPDLGNSARTYSNTHYRMSGRTAGADGSRQHAPEAVDTIPLKPASHPGLSRSIDGASSASLPGPQDSSPLTRPASLAQSEVSSLSASNTSLHSVRISTPTPGLRLCEAPSSCPSAAESLERVPRYASKQIPTQSQQAAGMPPAVGKARGNSVWSTPSSNYSGDEWGQNWYEECPGIVAEDYLPS